jgi:hypothetical protein
MAKPAEQQHTPPTVPDDKPGDPRKQRRQAALTMGVSLLLIIVALLFIVNEVLSEP